MVATPDPESDPARLLEYFAVPGESIYVLGSHEQRVTLYSQQVRALNLVYALSHAGQLAADARVAVIGAGASGITAAAALAHLGCAVQLIERADVLLPLQRGCRTRWIHPHIYDWPEPGSEDDTAALPLVGWTASYAHDVANMLEQALERASAASKHQIAISLSAEVDEVTGGSRPTVSWRGQTPVGKPEIRVGEQFAAVIVAVGFGLEEGTPELPMKPYWRNDDLDQPVLRPTGEPINCLVSGNGDGGLIETLRLRLRNFKLESLHEHLHDELSPSDFERLTSELRDIEARQHTARDDKRLWSDYSKLPFPRGFRDGLRVLLRTDTRVWIASREAPITARSAVLNRLWVALLLQEDRDGTKWIRTATRSACQEGDLTRVTYADSIVTAGTRSIFDRVIVRHGPRAALAGTLYWIGEKCGHLRERCADDKTRWPAWEIDVTFGPHLPAERSAEQVGRHVRTGSGGRGIVVQSARAVDVEPDERRQVRFVDVCRVEEASLRTAAGVTLGFGEVRASLKEPPVIVWHPRISKAVDLVLRSAGALDDVIRTSPWAQLRESAHVNTPAFKQQFFMQLDNLVNAEAACKEQFAAMCLLLDGEPIERAVDAMRTFAALSALRMIARLEAFEGMLRTPSGELIVNLFPDLPPVKSSWLLRRVPYRSRTAGLALGVERIVLCRVGPHENSYQYVLLPVNLAERLQDLREGVPEADYFRWIVPQWFIQRYEGYPARRGMIVWVLMDEYGRERYISSQPSPWGREELEEEPHPSIVNSELVDIDPGWPVLVGAAGSNPIRSPVRPRLAGYRLLWVDDHPENNLFEIAYLERLGATVERATTTTAALAYLREKPVDLVISDLSRSESGTRRADAGLELHEHIAQGALTMKPPMIFYTSDRNRVPERLREDAADQRRQLMDLVMRKLRP